MNDRAGPAAGDELLRDVVRCVADEIRSYDLIVRYGGDEFVCALSGESLPAIEQRFARIAARLAEISPEASFSVGLAELGPDDTISALLERADRALIASRPSTEDQASSPETRR